MLCGEQCAVVNNVEVPRENDASRFKVKGVVAGVSLDMLLDSGAAVSVLREGLVNTKIYPTKYSNFTGANGGLLDVCGVVYVWVELYGLLRKVQFYVVKNLNQNCILGVNGLRAFNVRMDFRNDKVVIAQIENRGLN